MSNTITIAAYIERARKVLQYEQRSNHQDRLVQGGLELFAVRWSEDFSAARKEAGLDLRPLQRFMEHLESYRQQDPLQRSTNVRAALSILDEMERGPEPAALDSSITSDATRVPAAHAPEHAGNTPRVPSSTQARKSVPGATDLLKAPPDLTHDHQKPKEELTRPEAPIQLDRAMSPGHASLALLSADVTAVAGVGASTAARLRTLGIRTIRDLLFYFPRQHLNYSKLTKIADIPFQEVTTTIGLIWEVNTKRTGKGIARTVASIGDETGRINVTWFNQGYLQKQLSAAKSEWLVVTGVKQRFGNKVEFSVRSHELPEQGASLNTGRMVPVYPLTEGLRATSLRKYTKWAVDHCAHTVPDHLPPWLRAAGRFMTLPEAVSQIHYPESEQALEQARRRLAFDELFLIQLGMQERRTRWQREAPQGNAFKIDPAKIFLDADQLPPIAGERADMDNAADAEGALGGTLWSTIATDQPFEATLPFRFTDAQRRVIQEIFGDLARSQPMSRLLQGDVGAGKTAVAAATLLMAALNGFQGAIMAPTELLAEQHARSISAMLEPFGIKTVLLTGNSKARERNLGKAALESGEALVAIGTHALIQDDVAFRRLGLVIIDEQHRFGVEQRDALRRKGYHPHMLVMTATPIPRTLALTLYGDLDVSVIDQLPPGRQKIITRWRSGQKRNEANYLIAQQVAEGRQAFIICPLIEESETLAAKAATVEYERLSKEVFPRLRLGLLHGGMKPAEKDQIMHDFRDHKLDILVATSVIEVGIDVPNATVMVIEDADRFGLSQLHQFRGRVGRGKHQSYCYVLSEDASLQAQDRLVVFQDTDDGFRLSEHDLRLRGPGDFIGVRQSGMPELKIADLNDIGLIETARTLAAQLWEADPYLRKPEHAPLRERMHIFWQGFMAH
jgi:ATP-dependent DNA helicase RecG